MSVQRVCEGIVSSSDLLDSRVPRSKPYHLQNRWIAHYLSLRSPGGLIPV